MLPTLNTTTVFLPPYLCYAYCAYIQPPALTAFPKSHHTRLSRKASQVSTPPLLQSNLLMAPSFYCTVSMCPTSPVHLHHPTLTTTSAHGPLSDNCAHMPLNLPPTLNPLEHYTSPSEVTTSPIHLNACFPLCLNSPYTTPTLEQAQIY